MIIHFIYSFSLFQYPNATYFTCLCSVPKPSASQNKGTDYQLKYQYYVHHYLTSGGKTHADHYDIGRTTYFNSDKHGKVILDNSVINGDFTSTSGYPGYIKILGYEIVPIYNGGLEINGVTKVKSSWNDYTITFAEGDY